jgi:hypothetical protein
MLRVAEFAKSSVKSEEIHDDEDPSSEGKKYSPPQVDRRYKRSLGDGSCDDTTDHNYESYEYDDHKDVGDSKSHYGFDERKLSNMDTMGLPAGFTVGQVEKQRKGEKRTFYCEMCLVELSSLDTMKSHVSGVKHMKKQMALSNVRDDKVRRGLITEEEAVRSTPMVRPIPNPESTKKKVPIRLHEKIRETKDPVMGLGFISEFIPVSDAEMEPHYECSICGNMGQSNGMFSHLMGHKHRQKCMENIYGDDPNMINLSQAELLRVAKKHSENHCKLSDLIRTRRSDEEYPWPPGKAPWAVERGGTGIPPDGARDNFDKKYGAQQPELEDPNTGVGRVLGSGEVELPAPRNVRPPSSAEEAEKMIDVGRKLISMAMEFSGSGVGERDGRVIQATMAAVLAKAQENLARGSDRS